MDRVDELARLKRIEHWRLAACSTIGTAHTAYAARRGSELTFYYAGLNYFAAGNGICVLLT